MQFKKAWERGDFGVGIAEGDLVLDWWLAKLKAQQEDILKKIKLSLLNMIFGTTGLVPIS